MYGMRSIHTVWWSFCGQPRALECGSLKLGFRSRNFWHTRRNQYTLSVGYCNTVLMCRWEFIVVKNLMSGFQGYPIESSILVLWPEPNTTKRWDNRFQKVFDGAHPSLLIDAGDYLGNVHSSPKRSRNKVVVNCKWLRPLDRYTYTMCLSSLLSINQELTNGWIECWKSRKRWTSDT